MRDDKMGEESASAHRRMGNCLENKKRKRRFGDRPDGRMVKKIDPMMKLTPYIMRERSDACNQFRGNFDVTSLDKYVQEKRAKGLKNFTNMHALLAAYTRVVSQRPALNRFVSGQKIYARNKLKIMLCVKKEMSLQAEESVISVIFPPDATAEQIYEIVENAIAEAKGKTTSFDGLVRTLDYIPGFIKRFAFWILRAMDYCGWLPEKLMHLSPFHGSMFITSMASIGLQPIYHHLYNFGNVAIFIAFGITERTNILRDDGSIESKKTVGYTVVCDERICDGYYYASAFRMLNVLIRNPWKLDVPPEMVVEDVE